MSQTPQAAQTSSAGDGPGQIVVVLTQEALQDVDARKIVALHEEVHAAYEVLVPADTRRNVVADILDHLALFEMRETLEALRPVDRQEAIADADEALETSLTRLREAGTTATGQVVDDDPMPALQKAVERWHPLEVVVVTEPQAVQDTFHTDWASRAREELGIPVLHMYTGDWRLG